MPRTTKNYRQNRDEAYREELPVGEQLDAVLKAVDMVLQSGGELPYELIDFIARWQDRKAVYPKTK